MSKETIIKIEIIDEGVSFRVNKSVHGGVRELGAGLTFARRALNEIEERAFGNKVPVEEESQTG